MPDFSNVQSLSPQDVIKSSFDYIGVYTGFILLVAAILLAPSIYNFLTRLIDRLGGYKFSFDLGMGRRPKSEKVYSDYYQFSSSNGDGSESGQSQKNIQKRIKKSMKSLVPGDRLEGEVALSLGDKVIGYQRNINDKQKGSIGEIDIETDKYIIEVTNGKSSKVSDEFDKYFRAPINPLGKKVILYAPNLKEGKIAGIEDKGVIVVRDITDLKRIVEG